MRWMVAAFAVLVFHVSLVSHAATSEKSDGASTAKLEQITPVKKFEEDKRITDLELRAAVGSMSRWSVKAELGYTGPAVNALYDQDRPNPNNSPGDFRTYLSGAMGVRYRLSPEDTLNLGVGVSWYNPYETLTGKPVDKAPGAADDVSIASPRLSYDHSYVVGNVQMRNNFKLSWTTDSQYVKVGQAGSVGYSHNMKYLVGISRLTLGLETSPTFYYYNREWIKKDRNTSNYGVGLYPNFSYRLLSSLDFAASVGYFFKNLRNEGSWFKWKQDKITARLGFGWSITKEIYLNPYLNLFTQDPKLDTTTFALGTVFSVF